MAMWALFSYYDLKERVSMVVSVVIGAVDLIIRKLIAQKVM